MAICAPRAGAREARTGEVPKLVQLSNELEFNLHGTSAARVIGMATSKAKLSVVPEINERDVVELNVSLASDIRELNRLVDGHVRQLRMVVEECGGQMYGGSSVLSDVSSLEPRRHRTTSLSERLAHGFLDISSQQLVLGIGDRSFGFELYNILRNIHPAVIAITASSPYRYNSNASVSAPNIEDTGFQSRRIAQYEDMCVHLPSLMWRDAPELSSEAQYGHYLQQVSDEVLRRVAAQEIDANMAELTRPRSKDGTEFRYYPFTTLEPHQLYWLARFRPDHRNDRSLYSLELRSPDIPLSISGIQTLNAFVVGIAYYAAEHGAASVPRPFTGTFEELKEASRDGLRARLSTPSRSMESAVLQLREIAAIGLDEAGFPDECFRLERIDRMLTEGNDAELIRRSMPRDATSLKDQLCTALRNGM